MANKPKAEPGYPRHDGEDPTFPNKAKLDIISGQEKPELIDLHSDDDDPGKLISDTELYLWSD